MTLLWFVVICICSLIGEPENLEFGPINAWVWWLLAAVAWDLWTAKD